jgi:hypothetical protein
MAKLKKLAAGREHRLPASGGIKVFSSPIEYSGLVFNSNLPSRQNSQTFDFAVGRPTKIYRERKR